jgi:hypothetical protein
VRHPGRGLTAPQVVAAASTIETVTYPAAGVFAAVTGLGLLLKPAAVIAAHGGGALPTLPFSLIGATNLILVAAAYRCYNAATRDNLTSDTYQRLTLSLAGVFALRTASALLYSPGFTAIPTTAQVSIVFTGVMAAALTSIWFKHSARPAYILKDAFGTAGDLLTPPASTASALYTALTVAVAALGASFLTAAGEGMVLNAQQFLGGNLIAAAAVGYTLKNGADRGRLNRGTFKLLNEAVAAASAAAAVVLYRAGGALTPVVSGLGAVALVCGYLGLQATAAAATSSSEAQAKEVYQYDKISDPLDALCTDDPDAEECKVFDT